MISFFFSTYSALMIFFIFLEQALVAISTICIIKITDNISDANHLKFWVIAFFLSLTLVYLPAIMRVKYTAKAKAGIQIKYIIKYSNELYGWPILAHSTKFKEERKALIENESWIVISSVIDYLSTFLILFFNIILNIIVLGLIIDPRLLISYISVFPILLIFIFLTKEKVSLVSQNEQKSRANLQTINANSWNSILLGNKLSLDLWTGRFLKSAYDYLTKTTNTAMIIESIACATMLISVFPVLVVTGYMLTAENDPLLKMALIATLPRQIITIHNLSDLISSVTHWNSFKARFNGIMDALIPEKDLSHHIGKMDYSSMSIETHDKFGNILYDPMTPISLDHIVEQYTQGRFTIRGKNGSGKTTALYILKQKIGNKAFLLPPHSDLAISDKDYTPLSTGEKLLVQISALMGHANADYIFVLLDEWDANLDSLNKEKINTLINNWSKTKCIIEVRHKQ